MRGSQQEDRLADLDAVDHEDVGRKSHTTGKCDTVCQVYEPMSVSLLTAAGVITGQGVPTLLKELIDAAR
ncbi:hypothetical protein GCM10012289_53200 [Nonomuraea cavernae]|uniref:Uncharacterized protein n=1 Tax=Nonomuraea cavernae TaxID=2045107 RepID=A0A917Z7K8_9ACTN|nr:hypothetical protein GCM10012289_53200 [Nonomuraea cavernae]